MYLLDSENTCVYICENSSHLIIIDQMSIHPFVPLRLRHFCQISTNLLGNQNENISHTNKAILNPIS